MTLHPIHNGAGILSGKNRLWDMKDGWLTLPAGEERQIRPFLLTRERRSNSRQGI